MIIDAQTRIPRIGTIGTNGVLKGREILDSIVEEMKYLKAMTSIQVGMELSAENPMPEGVYVYRLEMRSKTNRDIVKSGVITLLR